MAKAKGKSRTRPARKNAATTPPAPNEKITTCLLVADGAVAQLYDVAPRTCRLSPVPKGKFKHASLPGRLLVSDRPGHSSYAGGQRRHALEPRSEPHARAEAQFLKKVAAAVNAWARTGRFDRLVVAAPPKAMHVLREAFNAASKKKTVVEITHEWTRLGVRDMADRLKAALGPA
jgi:protein required for attachment to host cells